MHWMDIVILALMGWFAVKGVMNGMVQGLFRLAGMVIGSALAIKNGQAVGGWFVNQFGAPEQVGGILGYMAIFLIIVLIAQIAAGMIKSVLDFAFLGWLDKFGGFVFGAVKALILAFVLFFGLSYVPSNKLTDTIQDESRFYGFYENVAPKLISSYVQPMLGGKNMSNSINSISSDIFSGVDDPDYFTKMLDKSNVFTKTEMDYLFQKFKSVSAEDQEKVLKALKSGKTDIIYDLLTK